jgi:hypothetical protein
MKDLSQCFVLNVQLDSSITIKNFHESDLRLSTLACVHVSPPQRKAISIMLQISKPTVSELPCDDFKKWRWTWSYIETP